MGSSAHCYLNYSDWCIFNTELGVIAGSKKSSALDRVIEALEKVNESTKALAGKPKLFGSNETVTMPKLYDLLNENEGCYLALNDEMDWIFEALEKNDSLDRRAWLSLYGGSSWSRANKRTTAPPLKSTRLNYTGKKFVALILLLKFGISYFFRDR